MASFKEKVMSWTYLDRFTEFKITTERIGNMVTLLALNNLCGFIYACSHPWYYDKGEQNVFIWYADSAKGGLWLAGIWLCLIGGIIAAFLIFILHWLEAKIAEYVGSEWIASCIAKQLKWSLMIAVINCSGWGLIWGFQVRSMIGSETLGVGFFAMIQNVFFACVAVCLLLYIPCADNERGDNIWNAYGLFGGDDEEDEEGEKEPGMFAGLWGGDEPQEDDDVDFAPDEDQVEFSDEGEEGKKPSGGWWG